MSVAYASASNITRVPVAPQSDFLLRQARAAPVQALAECIWNSLDADATQVDIELNRDAITLRSIVIRDNGRGIARADAPELFRKLGDSWKRKIKRTDGGRTLHGSEGRGRYKVTALGKVADWHVIYTDAEGFRKKYTISLLSSDPTAILITDEIDADEQHTGVELVITEPLADFRSLQSEDAPQDLAEIFATYLRDYNNVSLSLQGMKIDPSTVIASTDEGAMSDIEDDGRLFSARLEIVEWNRPTKRVLYLCDENGFPLLSVDTRWHVGGHFFSAYLRSSLLRIVSDRNEIGVAEMVPALAAAIEEAKQRIKEHFRRRAARAAQSVVDDWKDEKIYPYSGNAKTPIEQVERDVFDIVAVTASRYIPDFSSTPTKSRAFNLRMMKTAIENSSEDLQLILTEVLNLPAKQQEELAHLLQETSLLSIISASKIVADRLKFLTGLHALIFDENISSSVKERTQLHRILADKTWIFGEEFQLMVDDRSLNECLVQHHVARTGRKPGKGAVKHPSKSRGIVDLMFGRQRRMHRPDDLEHLVVELKAPEVDIGEEQIIQIDGYVQSILNDSRFDKSTTRWIFWALSKNIDEAYVAYRQVEGRSLGTITYKPNVQVIVRTWAQIISENRSRMQFFQESLQHNASKTDALASLKNNYEKIFLNTPAGLAIDGALPGAE